jgi:hypothetical protein
MEFTPLRRGRRTLFVLALAGALVALTMMLGAASQIAQAKTRQHAHHHAVHRAHRTSADPTSTTDQGSSNDPAGGPNDQSGAQSGPNDQTGGPDTESNSSEGESGTSNDGPGGPNSNCADNQGCQ